MRSITLWLSRLTDSSEAVRKRAQRAFCSLTPNHSRLVPQLVAVVEGGDPVLGFWAARGLSGIGPAAADAVPALIVALDTPDAQFRFWVATALWSIGPTARDAIPKLVTLLDDPAPWVRQAVATGLVEIAPGDDAAATPLIERLSTDVSESVRVEFIRALGRSGSPRAVLALGKALSDRNHEVQRVAAIHLKVLGSRAKAAIDDIRKALTAGLAEGVRLDLEIALNRIATEPDGTPLATDGDRS